MKIGDAVIFVDSRGAEHNALVIHAWESSLNIAYIDPQKSDTFGNLIIRETSVPFYEIQMVGFYIKATDD